MTEDNLDHKLTTLVLLTRRYTWGIVIGLVVMVLGQTAALVWLISVNSGYTAQNARDIASNQRVADQRWCATIGLLTAVPVARPANPSVNPSRVASYELYQDFLTLKKEFGCP